MKIFNINSKEDIEYQVEQFIIRPDFKELGNTIVDRLSDPEWRFKTPEEKARLVVKIAGMSIGIPAAMLILERLGFLSMFIIWLSFIWR